MTQTTPLYAQDATPIDPAADRLEDCIQAHPPCTWAALVDTAFDHGRATPALRRHDTFNCYDFPDLKGLAGAAPCLLVLPGSHAPGFKTALRALLHHCSGRPMLSFVALRQDTTPRQAVEHWHPLHWAHTSDGQKLLLRFADTRTLAALPAVLAPPQWAAWTAPLSAWYAVDRTGAIAALPWPDGTASSAAARTLDIGDAQLAAFVESSEPDAALQFLREHLPDILPAGMTGHGFYRQASQALDRARQHGIANWGDQMALVAAALMSGGMLLRAPALDALLAARGWQPGQLGPHLAAQAALAPYVSPPEAVS